MLTAKDVIIHKLIAGRYQDMADIDAILETKLTLDQEYIENWANFWDVLDRWKQMRV